jgi:hypothetical protein
MPLLTVDDVTAWVPQAAANEDLLEEAIRLATNRANYFTRRRLDRATYDERYDVEPGQSELNLRQYPVSEVAAVYVDPDDTNELLSEVDDYLVDEEAGVLTRVGTDWPVLGTGVRAHWASGPAIVRVQYTAGYAPETLNSTETGADLKEALLQIVAWVLSNRGAGGLQQQSADGVTVVREEMVRGLPKSLAGLLEDHARAG